MITDSWQTSAVNGELTSGERVLWQGRPDASRWLMAQDWYLIPFSLMWGGFAVFWEAGVLSSRSARSTVIFPLWGVPFVVIGVYLIFGRFFVRHRILKATRYAITDERVIEVSRSLTGAQRMKSVWLRSYPPIDKKIGGNGRGTLWIGQFPVGRSFAADPGWPGAGRMTTNGVIFADIGDAAEVAALLANRVRHAPS